MGTLTAVQVIAALGFRVIVDPEIRREILRAPLQDKDGGVVGEPVGLTAALCLRDAEFVIVVEDLTHATLSDAIHEALHGVIGAPSFDDEEALMGLEWHVCQELTPKAYAVWRQEFGHYGLGDGGYVGEGNNFLTKKVWRECVDAAIRLGLLTQNERVVWGYGPHHTLKSYHQDCLAMPHALR